MRASGVAGRTFRRGPSKPDAADERASIADRDGEENSRGERAKEPPQGAAALAREELRSMHTRHEG